MTYFLELGAESTEDVIDVAITNGDLKALDMLVKDKSTAESFLEAYKDYDLSDQGYAQFTLFHRSLDYLRKKYEL